MAKTTRFDAKNLDDQGNTVTVTGEIKVYQKPTVTVTLTPDPAVTPIHSGDEVVFQVEATTDSEAGPGKLTLFIDGQERTLSGGRYVWVAP